MSKVFEAIEFAARAHSGQYRKGTRVPYLVHSLNVAKILIEAGAREPVVIAGLLHDVVEDTRVRLEQIEEAFGEEVADLVSAASEPNRSDSWEKRKQHTLAFLETAPLEPLLISLADKLDNIRSIQEELDRDGDSMWDKFSRGREQQRWYYEGLARHFSRRLEHGSGAALAEEFARRVNLVFGTTGSD